jgi:uncharacterized metal-binding protein YceD (DUF177 family)
MTTICLKTTPYGQSQTVTLLLNERLPAYLASTPTMTCTYTLTEAGSYWLLSLSVTADLPLICHHCVEPYVYAYACKTVLAICRTEVDAERLLSEYETVVAIDGKIDLEAILTDDLYLYAPEKNPAH